MCKPSSVSTNFVNNTERKVEIMLPRDIEYEGRIFSVPSWANYIAADSNGDVFAFEEKPTKELIGLKYITYMINTGKCQWVSGKGNSLEDGGKYECVKL